MEEEIKKKKVTIVGGKEGKKGGHVLRNLLITLVFGAIYFYFALPAVNLHNPGFYVFVFILAALYCVLTVFSNASIKNETDAKQAWKNIKKTCAVPLIICAALVVIFLVGTLLGSVIFRADDYTKLLPVQTGTFTEDVQQIGFDQIPMLDKASAERLGDRKLGELSDMVSQFEVSDDYSQINYKDRPVRVAYLQYGDIFKWFGNVREGLPAYIVIDMVTQEVQVVRLEEGIKYSFSDHFGRNIYRHLRFQYPTYMFDTPKFEIDEEGNPFWICPKIEKTIGLFGGTDISGAVLVNAVTGESTYYAKEDIPTWVDRVYSADLIIEQYDYYGQYQNGFLNSLFGQKNVTVTTRGYNYMAINDDVYVYTGVTSVTGDQSNIGFIMTNQRTKETTFYSCAGADEYSAMNSAQGQVQHLNYVATFPLLLNVSEQPTYFIALKDNAGLVKMFAMVNVQQYNIVATGSTVAETQSNYNRLLLQNNVTDEVELPSNEFTGVVDDVRSSVIEGNSYYYFRLQGDQHYYVISAAEEELAVIINPGDTVTITAAETEGQLRQALSVTLDGQEPEPDPAPETGAQAGQDPGGSGEAMPDAA